MLEFGFANAPVSKVFFLASVSYFFLDDIPNQYGLAVDHLLDVSQIWRLITSQIVFSRLDGALFGASAFYLFRQIERQMGSSKFAGLVLLVNTVAAIVQLQLMYFVPSIFAAQPLASGPYALITALMLLYCIWVPRRRRVVNSKIFGINVTEKLMTMLFIANCILAGGRSSMIPALTAMAPMSFYLSGAISTDRVRTPGMCTISYVLLVLTFFF